MTSIKSVEPSKWQEFLADFSERNRGRRARFEIFGRTGDFAEEDQEGHFQLVSVDGQTVTIDRTYEKRGREETMSDKLENVRGIAVQYDTDNSEDMIEFADARGNLTALHFESNVDGSS